MTKLIERASPIKAATAAIALILTAGCSVKSADAIEYFSEVGAQSAASQCDAKPESGWKVESFRAAGLDYQLVAPLGLICGRDAKGALQKAYRTAPAVSATHRAVYGTSFGVMDTVLFERRDDTGAWSPVG